MNQRVLRFVSKSLIICLRNCVGAFNIVNDFVNNNYGILFIQYLRVNVKILTFDHFTQKTTNPQKSVYTINISFISSIYYALKKWHIYLNVNAANYP